MPTRKNELSSFTGNWDIRPERQAPKGLKSYFFHFISLCFYISTDEVEMYWFYSRNGYFMVTQLRNYSTTTETTMTKFTLSCKPIYLGSNPKKNEFSSVTGYWDIRPERQAPKGLNSYFFSFHFVFIFVLPVRCPSHNWSKISSNQAEFLRTYRGINIVTGDA